MRKVTVVSFLRDTFLNGVSAVVYIGASQLFLYPYLSRHLGKQHFGMFLVIIGICNYSALIIGNTAGNLCLRHSGMLKRQESIQRLFASGAYLVLLASGTISIAITIISILISDAIISEYVFIAFVVLFTNIRAYIITEYRIRVAYSELLIYYIFLSSGLVIFGLLLSKISPFLPFLCSEITALIYCYISNRRIRIVPKKTFGFARMSRGLFQLGVANIGPTLFTYGDRWILGKFAGTEAVGVYYAATVTGKVSVTGIGILGSVLLTYLSKISRSRIRTLMRPLFFASIVTLIATFILLRFLSPLFTRLFYPDFLVDAIPLFSIIALGYSLRMIEHLIRALLVRYADLSILRWSDLIFGILLVLFGGIGASVCKAFGFAIAFAVIIAVKLLFNSVFAVITVRSNTEKQI